MAKIVVHVEHSAGRARQASLEALGAAKATGAEVVAVVADPGAAEVASALGAAGADAVVHFQGAEAFSPDAAARQLAQTVQDHGANALLAAASAQGRELIPRAAALLDSASIADCIRFEAAGDGYEAVRPVLAGKALATVRSSSPVFCGTLRPNVFPPCTDAAAGAVETKPSIADPKVVVTEIAAKQAGRLDVKEAPVVVSGGRGMKGPEHFHLLEELAAAFGDAAVGASRAVVDAGWRPHAEQVGQTGKTVAPQLYIAVGISGAIQHLAGMRTSRVIVAINKDADAPIFKLADYGIVGDAFEVVPALTEAVKTARAGK